MSVIAFATATVSALAQIQGQGLTVNLAADAANQTTIHAPSLGTTYTVTDSSGFTPGTRNGSPQGGNTGNLAVGADGNAFNPAYVRGSTPYHWDTEQLWSNTPWGERFVAEGRIGNQATNGNQELALSRPQAVQTSGVYGEHSGNVVPVTGAHSGVNAFGPGGSASPYAYTSQVIAAAAGQVAITSGQSQSFSIHYNAATGLVTLSQGGGTTSAFATEDGLASGERLEFSQTLLRVNVAPFNSAGTRTLSLQDLEFQMLNPDQSPDGGRIAINNDVTLSNSILATATSTGAVDTVGQRQFILLQHASMTQNHSFRISGTATYTWNTGAIPNGSQMAFQFKFGDGITPVPEPSSFALFAGLAGLALTVTRRRRR